MKKILLMCLLATSAFAADKTERTFNGKCSACHGKDGKASTEKGRKMKIQDLTDPVWKKKTTDAQIKKSILEGVDNGDKQMDPYKDELTPEQVDALVLYVRNL